MKQFKGKAIYNPSGAAGEYSNWACNFYTGCSNNCSYCYCKRGVMSSVWSDKPYLKSCFRDNDHAIVAFRNETLKNLTELREHGLFFSFTTDPMLPETIELTLRAANSLVTNGIPIKVLTKRADWVDYFLRNNGPLVCDGEAIRLHKVAFGFTLTGHDELEPCASTNQDRIEAIRKLHEAGFKTFASIEPIINFESAMSVIRRTLGFCDLYKVGMMSGSKDKKLAVDVYSQLCRMFTYKNFDFERPRIYIKDSIYKAMGYERADLSGDEPMNFVGRDYNIFKETLPTPESVR